MRFVTDFSKGILGKPDSVEMWQDIIANIPDEVFLKKDIKILDVAFGHGSEANVVVKRMLELGRTSEEIKNSIVLLDKYSVFTKDAERKGYKNIIQADFLDWNIDMKFDVIIGNPPYRQGEQHAKKIWPDFTVKSLDLLKENGYLGWVIPTGWLDSDNAQMKKVRTKLTSEFNLTNINRTADQYFDVGTEILYLVATNEPYKGKTDYKSFTDTYQFDLRKGLNKTPEEILIESIEQKIVNFSGGHIKMMHEELSNDIKKEKDDINKHYVIYSTANRGYSATKPKNTGELKLALNVSSSFYSSTTEDNNMPITNEAIGGLMYYILLDDVEQGKRIKSFLSTKLIRFFASVYKRRNSGFCHAVRQEKIPNVDFSKTWSDAEVYSLFNITKEEQDFIESYN